MLVMCVRRQAWQPSSRHAKVKSHVAVQARHAATSTHTHASSRTSSHQPCLSNLSMSFWEFCSSRETGRREGDREEREGEREKGHAAVVLFLSWGTVTATHHDAAKDFHRRARGRQCLGWGWESGGASSSS